MDQVVDGESLNGLVRSLRRAVTGTNRDAVYESLRTLIGARLDYRLCYEYAWRFSGNINKLREGEPVRPWTAQREDEWVPVQVLTCWPAKNKYRKIGRDIRFRALAGTPCPMELETFWTKGATSYVSTLLGFSRFEGPYRMQSQSDIVGLRMLVRIDALLSRGQPVFKEVKCPPSLVNWNRELVLKLRFRHGMRCPRGWHHPCHRCAIGYKECPAATHKETFEVGHCTACRSENAIYDPEMASGVCRECTIKKRMSNATVPGFTA